ncbi:MAG: hypothetical protein CSA81_10055 [Acidobacteria bacterium]|nr:MAG: hypothetical protein CSA81_10055 [Acidobacteriota bacterium]PIE90787.1 MAG: hypothetical protein CR997_03950 [Acidobacteriota bacterium]
MSHLLMAHIAVFFMGMAGVLAGHSGFTPWQSTFYRVFLGTLILMFVWFFMPAKKKLPWKIGVASCFLGALLGFHWFAFFKSIELLGVTLGSALIGTEPIIVAICALFLLKEKLSNKIMVAMLVSTLGFFLLLLNSEINSSGIFEGCLWAIGAYCLFGLLVVANRKLVRSHSPILITALEMAGAIPIALLFAEVNLVPDRVESWMFALGLGVLCTGLAYYLYNSSMKKLPANIAGALLALEVAYGMAAGWLLGDSLSLIQAGAALLIANILFLDLFEYMKKKRVTEDRAKHLSQ